MIKNNTDILIYSCPSFKQSRVNNKISNNFKKIYKNNWIINFSKNKKVFVVTYGCQANYRDSEKVVGIFLYAGFKLTDSEKDADIVFVNTCAVREKAEKKVFSYLERLKNKIIIFSGCMAMEEKIVKKIIDKKMSINIVISINNIGKIFFLLKQHIITKKNIVDVNSNFFNVNDERLPNNFNFSNFKAFVNVNYGCDKLCTYCIVPYTRGPEIDRNFKDIIDECRKLADLNYQEIVLIGQNVSSYGIKHDTTFAKLLDEVAKLKIPRIYFLTCHPYDFSLDIIRIMKKHKNILPYLHLPIQSGDDNILKLMGRKYNSQYYLKLVDNIRKIFPDIVLSTDIIIGFPTETDKEFKNTLKIVQQIKFDNIFMFIFSKRHGTPAYNMVDNVSDAVKKNRFQILDSWYMKIIEEKNKKYLNNIYDVLVDGISKKNKNTLEGRLITNKIVHFFGKKSMIGKIIKVKITETHPFFLFGEVFSK
ncbi:MAG: tRNA (N6-isopentenyl adenosine(37)-C2)-methylthiotransferase MiaB [Bacilli bacterium]|nr:tRNA (N6-isopentenyl adenosine(37)-C2)-methylthiotransferase MiaB [Bacilli bacterium]